MHASTSYAKAMENPDVQKKVESVAADYDGMLRELKKEGAKGVVVAINGRILWADVFASTDLLEKYWQKLIRSYAADSLTTASEQWSGRSEVGAAISRPAAAETVRSRRPNLVCSAAPKSAAMAIRSSA